MGVGLPTPFDIRHGDTGYGDYPVAFLNLALIQYFLTLSPTNILYHCVLEMCNRFCEFAGNHSWKPVLRLRKDIELLNSVETEKLWGLLKLH